MSRCRVCSKPRSRRRKRRSTIRYSRQRRPRPIVAPSRRFRSTRFARCSRSTTLPDDDGGMEERWNGGTVERWNGGTVERWNGGTVERWNGGTVERWNGGTVERWNGGTVERWNGGTVERWKRGTGERWNGGTVERVNSRKQITAKPSRFSCRSSSGPVARFRAFSRVFLSIEFKGDAARLAWNH